MAWGTWALVIVTSIFIGWQIRASQKASSLQLFVQLTHKFEEPSMRHLRKEFAALLHSSLVNTNLKVDPIHDETVLAFFENLAYFTHHGFLDVKIVWNYFVDDVCGYWNAAKPHIIAMRKNINDEELYIEMQWLNDGLTNLDAKRSKGKIWSQDKIRRYLEAEINLI